MIAYSLGPWTWTDDGWVPPAGLIGGVDLGSLPDQATPGADRPVGFFATEAQLPGEYALLGIGDLRELNATGLMRSAFESAIGLL